MISIDLTKFANAALRKRKKEKKNFIKFTINFFKINKLYSAIKGNNLKLSNDY